MKKPEGGFLGGIGFQESFFFAERAESPAIHLPFEKNFFLDLTKRNIFVGTSSWKFRGWENLFYHERYRSEAEFQRECLREYARYLPVVGVDFTYYDWPHTEQMERIFQSVPNTFQFCFKVTDQLLIETFPAIPRYGRMAGMKNPLFLCAKTFNEKFWKPLELYKNNIASIIFEFPRFYSSYWPLFTKFLCEIPQDISYSFELRNSELCIPSFYQSLEQIGVAPAFNIWTKMPTLAKQFSFAQNFSYSHLVVRALLQPGMPQETAVTQFSPFSQLLSPYPEFYSSMANLTSYSEKKKIPIYILVSNCLEGSAPLTIGKLQRYF